MNEDKELSKANNFIIKTNRLILRPLGLNDLETTHEYASDEKHTKYMEHLPNDNLDQTRQFLQRVSAEWQKAEPSFYEFAIILNQRHIGAVSLYLDEVGCEGELGWIINSKYQGNGYATEAAKAIFEFGVNELKVKKVVAHCDYRNVGSYKVMGKLGLTLESESGQRQNKGSNEYVKEYKYSLIIN